MASKVPTRIIYWRAPALMLASLVVGICLSIGHHLFCSSLHAREVSDQDYALGSWKVSSQQVNIAAGTAFGFAVKTSLVFTPAIAYMQLFFRMLARESNLLQKLDQWYSGLSDLVSLCCIATYWRRRSLALLAITSWLLPLAAILAPAALTVTFSRLQTPPTTSLVVPQPAFDSFAFLSNHGYNTSLTNFTEDFSFDPHQEVLRVANAAAASASILDIEPPGINASWQIALDLPKMVCEDMDQDLRQRLKKNLLRGLEPSITTLLSPWNFQTMFSYLAWTPWDDMAFDDDLNLVHNPVRLPFVEGDNGTMEFLPQPANSLPEFYVSIFPRANTMPPEAVWTKGRENFGTDTMDWYFADATILHCRQVASKYDIHFSYDGPNQEQHIHVISETDIEPSWIYNESVMFFIGNGSVAQQEFNRHNIRYLSINAIWDTFVSLIAGASNAAASRLGVAELQTFVSNTSKLSTKGYATQVFSTSLADTAELATIIPPQVSEAVLTLGNNLTKSTLDLADALLSPVDAKTTDRMHLKDALEQLFFNVTISMTNSKQLLYNASNPFAPPNEDVTFNLFGTVYNYDSAKLWLAYGLAIGVTVINAAIGLITMFHTGASFTANFSTIVRAAKNADILQVDTEEPNLPGKDPVSKELAHANFALRSSVPTSTGSDEAGSVMESINYARVSQTDDGHQIDESSTAMADPVANEIQPEDDNPPRPGSVGDLSTEQNLEPADDGSHGDAEHSHDPDAPSDEPSQVPDSVHREA